MARVSFVGFRVRVRVRLAVYTVYTRLAWLAVCIASVKME